MRMGLGISGVAVIGAAVVLSACAGSAAPSSAGPSSATPQAQAATATATSSAANSPTAAAKPAANSVQITMFKFAPASIEVARGTTVNWTNQDQILHTVSAGTPAKKSGQFDQRMPDVGAKFSYEFKDAGTFPFFCDIHQFMTGEVVVR